LSWLTLNKIVMKKYTLIVVALLSGVVFFGVGFILGKKSFQIELNKNREEELSQQKTDEALAAKEAFAELERIRSKVCNEAAAIDNFKNWMELYYPDWKIYGEVIVVPIGDCSYNLRFSTVNPYMLQYGMRDKEIMIMQLRGQQKITSRFNHWG